MQPESSSLKNQEIKIISLCSTFKVVELHLTARSAKSISNSFMIGLLIVYSLFVVIEESRFVII